LPGGDLDPFGEGVDDADADAMQAARGLVGLAGELPAGVQHGHDHLQRRLAGMLGCGSTGIPRPSSVTVSWPSASSRTEITLAWPATASSMALSSTSANRWCRDRSSVPPMYMPGRLRTGSRPSSTSMSLA